MSKFSDFVIFAPNALPFPFSFCRFALFEQSKHLILQLFPLHESLSLGRLHACLTLARNLGDKGLTSEYLFLQRLPKESLKKI